LTESLQELPNSSPYLNVSEIVQLIEITVY